jgi:hypothetical protein
LSVGIGEGDLHLNASEGWEDIVTRYLHGVRPSGGKDLGITGDIELAGDETSESEVGE